MFYTSLVTQFGGALRLPGEIVKMQVHGVGVLRTVLRPLQCWIFSSSQNTEYDHLYYPKPRSTSKQIWFKGTRPLPFVHVLLLPGGGGVSEQEKHLMVTNKNSPKKLQYNEIKIKPI